MFDNLFSSTNHPTVNWCSLNTLFAMHFSYGFSLNPKYDSVVENKSYHRRVFYIIPHITFKISTYSTFLTFSYVTTFFILWIHLAHNVHKFTLKFHVHNLIMRESCVDICSWNFKGLYRSPLMSIN